jgi:Yip1-like protein
MTMRDDSNQTPGAPDERPAGEGQGYQEYPQPPYGQQGAPGYPPPPPSGGQAYPPPPGYQGAPGYPPPPPPPPPPGYQPGYQGYQAYPGGAAAAGAYGVYGAPYAPTQPPQPAGWAGLPQKWLNVTTRPGVTSFVNELPTANWRDIWLPLIGLAVLAAITGAISGLYESSTFTVPDAQTGGSRVIHLPAGTGIGSLIGVPLGFFIAAGVLFVCAKIFGGSGSFLHQAYAMSLYWVPLEGITAIAGLIPVLGGIVSFLVGIYMIVEAVFAIAASHRLSTGRATAAVLLPVIVAVLLACALIVLFIGLIAAAVNGGR